MRVKVQTVNELTINQLSEDQYKAEKAAGRIKSGEVYACTPSPVKWEDIQGKPIASGGDVDLQELARHIPSWQWKVTMPKTTHQTVTATVGSETYTDDFYAPQGSKVAFSVKSDTGYIAGSLSTTIATLANDLTVTITAATESENIEAGTKTFGNVDQFTVPPKVNVLKWTWNGKDTYSKVNPGQRFTASIINLGDAFMLNNLCYSNNIGLEISRRKEIDPNRSKSSEPLTVAWSKEINEHAYEYDWTRVGNSEYDPNIPVPGEDNPFEPEPSNPKVGH